MSATIADIQDGKLDDDLDIITEAIRDRRKLLASRKVIGIKPGDTVQFSDNIRPKYLVGRTATVVKRNTKSIVVSCPDDPAYGRFQNSKNVRCPNDLIAGAA